MADKSPDGKKQRKAGIKNGPGSCLKETIINKKNYEIETISRNGRIGPDGNKHTAG